MLTLILLPKENRPLPIDFEVGGVYLPPIAQALLLAQRIPVRIEIDPGYAGKDNLRAGTTATVTVRQ